MRCLSFSFLMLFGMITATSVAADPTYLLAPELAAGDTSSVKVTVKIGGHMYQTDEEGEQQLPLSVAADFDYVEQLLAWPEDTTEPARSLREYKKAEVKVQKGERGHNCVLSTEKRTILAELQKGRTALASAGVPLTRAQHDLINVVGNSLALNRLLPGRELAEGDTWEHDTATIGALLDMDNVVVCEVNSVVTGCEHHQVQIRMAGTVQGTVDGAPAELELRAAYLFHEKQKRITKFNLAIKEVRTASQLVHGLDVVAKISVKISPTESTIDRSVIKSLTDALPSDLSYEAEQRGYRFLHDSAWYIVAEQSDRVSLRSLHSGNVTAHCSLTTLPARSEGRETTLEEFERDVREMLGDHLSSVSASTQWTTKRGHDCLGVVAHGETEGIPIEWRHYLISSPGLPRVSLSVTVEQSQLEAFSDADRQIVDTLELVKKPVTETAKAKSGKTAR